MQTVFRLSFRRPCTILSQYDLADRGSGESYLIMTMPQAAEVSGGIDGGSSRASACKPQAASRDGLPFS